MLEDDQVFNDSDSEPAVISDTCHDRPPAAIDQPRVMPYRERERPRAAIDHAPTRKRRRKQQREVPKHRIVMLLGSVGEVGMPRRLEYISQDSRNIGISRVLQVGCRQVEYKLSVTVSRIKLQIR